MERDKGPVESSATRSTFALIGRWRPRHCLSRSSAASSMRWARLGRGSALSSTIVVGGKLPSDGFRGKSFARLRTSDSQRTRTPLVLRAAELHDFIQQFEGAR